MKRKLGIAAVVVVLLVVVLWRRHGRDAATTPTNAKVVADVSAPGAAGKAHIDPRKLERASIAGTITDEDHAPVARARVCVDASSHDLPAELTRDPHCTNSDELGRYAIGDLLAANYTASAMAKPYRPAVYHPDGDFKQTEFLVGAGEHKTAIDLVMRKGGVEITGTVSDLTGGPIARATVRASSGWWSSEGRSAAIETDELGKFSLWVKPGDVIVTALADGYATGEDNGAAPGKFDILLTPESSLAGTVIDAKTKEPVAGVPVVVASGGWLSWGNMVGTGDITDDKGHFHVSRLSPERYQVAARSATGYGQSDGSTLVGLGQHVDGVIVKLFPAVRVAGRVVIPDAKKTTCKMSSLSLHDLDRKRYVAGIREPDGTLHADGVLPGTYEVDASCDGYKSRDKYSKLEVKDQDLLGLEWEVEVGAIIRGKVLTASGTPVEDVSVWARTTGGAAREKTAWGSDASKKDGGYVLDGLKAGSYTIEAGTDRGVAPKDGWKVEVASGATVQKDLILEDVGSITGTVSDADGKPVGGVRVSARSSTGSWSFGGNNDVRSSDDGTFKIEGQRPGDYRVLAHRGWWSDDLRKPGSNDDAKQGEKVTVRAAQAVSVKLVVESQSGTIKGTVTDPAGKPVSDAFISAARESDAAGSQRSSVGETRWSADERPVLTTTDGTFAVTKLSPGNYTLRAFRKGGGEAIAEHVPVGGTAKLQIKPTGSIEGTIHRAGGAPDELSIEIEDQKTSFSRTESFFRSNGVYAVHDLPLGHFTVTASAEHGQKQTTVDLSEGEHKTRVDVELDALVTLTGRVVELEGGKPVPGIMMTASIGKNGGGFSFSNDGDAQENVSDEAGHFTIKNAPRGPVTIHGFPKDWSDSDYGFIQAVRTIEGNGTIDIADIKVLKRRVKKNDPVGELGIHFAEQPDDTPIDKYEYKVSWIDPAGSAAKTELKIGDVITSIDGIDCTGANHSNGWVLMRAPPATALKLGLARGATVTVTLAAP